MLTEMLSRIQFAFTVSFHIIFPAFSIGLATFLAVLEGMWLKTKKPIYYRMCRFFTKIFALTFGMGVVSGIIMSFQLGTNWGQYADAVGPVLGSLFTYEVLTAFFVEAGFLGVMLFGWNRVGPKMHYAATLCVFFGVTLSAFWILAANSWMQTPDGASFFQGHFHPESWAHIILNHSTIPRFLHMLVSSYLATSFAVAGIAAAYWLKQRHSDFAKTTLSLVLWFITVLAPVQLILGDGVGREVHDNQPIKTAAMEGVWETGEGLPFLVFAWPDQDKQKNDFAIKIPHMASLINTHQWNGKLVGLKTVPPKDQPHVASVFFTFRIMVLCGLLFFAIALVHLWLRHRGRLFDAPWFCKTLVWMSPLGFIAIETGWMTAEIGRQPWTVYGILRTSQSMSVLTPWHVWASLIAIICVYALMFGFFYTKYLRHILHDGPMSEKSAARMPFAYFGQGVVKENENTGGDS